MDILHVQCSPEGHVICQGNQIDRNSQKILWMIIGKMRNLLYTKQNITYNKNVALFDWIKNKYYFHKIAVHN